VRRLVGGDVLHATIEAPRRDIRFRSKLDDEGALVLPLIFCVAVHASEAAGYAEAAWAVINK